ncbi:MAG: hypothetical protein ACTS3F_14555 [Phycisphaerales bacterium]
MSLANTSRPRPRRHQWGFSTTRLVTALALMFLGIAACVLAFRLVRADVSAEAYKRQLTTLASSYNDLRSTYNNAVRRMAVTELLVEDDRLSVLIRAADGAVQKFDTPLDPNEEVFVDYVVIDNRLWIRRVFDSNTPPAQGLLIDPALADIDWNSDRANHGKTVYRSLDEGRWIIDITRDGSLGLRRADTAEPSRLVPPPELIEHEPIEHAVEESLKNMTLSDVWKALFGRD